MVCITASSSSPILDYEQWSWSGSRCLGNHPAGYISNKPGGRLLLLSAKPVVTFPAKEITPLGWYQILLLGDRGTLIYVACRKPLPNGAQPGLEAVPRLKKPMSLKPQSTACLHALGGSPCGTGWWHCAPAAALCTWLCTDARARRTLHIIM